MTVTKAELQAYNKSDKSVDMITFIEGFRKKSKAITVEVKEEKKGSERQDIMEQLDSLGVEYKKNAKTADLKAMLVENS
jgi:hypothetical protein